jgi:hypothetical protein
LRAKRAKGRGQRAWGREHGAEGIGYGAWGMGHRAKGRGHGAEGRGHGAEGTTINYFLNWTNCEKFTEKDERWTFDVQYRQHFSEIHNDTGRYYKQSYGCR